MVSFLVLIHLFEFFFVLLQEWSRVSYEGDSPGIYPFDKVLAIGFCIEKLSGSFFLSFPLY